MSNSDSGTSFGLSILGAIAIVLSWEKNHSFWWALLHGILGSFYIIYRAIWAPWW